MRGKREKANARKKVQGSKLVTFLTIIAGFLIVQECLILMYLCIRGGFTATAAWLTAAVGVGEAVIIAGANVYMSLCKSDHKEGGITFETAKASGFEQLDGNDKNSPSI